MKQHFTDVAAAYPGTQAVLRAIAILKAFSDGQAEWSVSELARALKLNKTTVFRILSALEREGMVVRTPVTTVFRLGPAAIALGAQALRANDLRTVARAQLERLARESGETVTLEVLVRDEVLIVDEIASRHLVGSASEIGTRWPAHAASTGKVLLAAVRHGASASRTDPTTAIPARLPALTPRTITSPAALATELDRVWRRGYAIGLEEIEVGFVAVGAPLRDRDGLVIAALSVGGPKARLGKERVLELVRLALETADRISHLLGHCATAERGQSSPRRLAQVAGARGRA